MLLAQISKTVLTFSIYLWCKGQWYLYQTKKMCLCHFPLPRIPTPNITHPLSTPTKSLSTPKLRFLWKSHQMVGEIEGWIKDFPPASWSFLNPIPHSFWCRVNSFNGGNCINLCGLLIQESTSNSVSTSGNTQNVYIFCLVDIAQMCFLLILL